MSKRPRTPDGRPLRILITNDDGVHDHGLTVLERIARVLSNDVWSVAPETERSGASRAITLSCPLRLRQISPRHFAVTGTPADCVLMALRHILPQKPDLVLSGVNRGQNLGGDINYSGTVAAALEAANSGVCAMALSQSLTRPSTNEPPWDISENHAPALISALLTAGLDNHVALNINFPDCLPENLRGPVLTMQGKRSQDALYFDRRQDGRQREYFWFAFRRETSCPDEGTDLQAVYANQISVTPLHADLTHRSSLERLRQFMGTSVKS